MPLGVAVTRLADGLLVAGRLDLAHLREDRPAHGVERREVATVRRKQGVANEVRTVELDVLDLEEAGEPLHESFRGGGLVVLDEAVLLDGRLDASHVAHEHARDAELAIDPFHEVGVVRKLLQRGPPDDDPLRCL